MTIIAKKVTLPLVAVDRLWSTLDPGPAHLTLGIGDFWIPEENRERVTAAISDGLQQEGLGTLESPAPELVGTLRLIATATEEYYAWVNDIPSSDAGAVLASAKDGEAVLMVRDRQNMQLEPIPAEKLAERFVSTFAEVEAAQIPELSVPKASFSAELSAEQEAADEETGFSFAYEPDGPEEIDHAAKLRELLQARRAAVYQLYTAKRSGGPNRKRVGPYAMIDIIDEGRVLTFVSDAGAEPMIQCVPGSKDNLVKALTEAQAALG